MINEALNFISGELNNHFKNIFDINEDKAIVSNLVNSDGSVPIQINDKLVISLVNIEQETIIANQPFSKNTGQAFVVKNPAVNINLYLLFAAYFNNYDESLKFISATISFFQSNIVFLRSNYPTMGGNINKLVFELFKTDYQSINYLWGSIGAKYVPSMSYKMRMLTFDDENWKEEGALISKPQVNVSHA